MASKGIFYDRLINQNNPSKQEKKILIKQEMGLKI